jgi:PAS domain-containing protein
MEGLPGLEAALAVTEAVSRAKDVHHACEVALDAVRDVLGAERGAVLLYDEADALGFCGWRGLSDAYRARVAGHSPWPRDAVDPAPVLVEDAARDESLGALRDVVLGEGIRALAFVPLAHEGRLLGKFVVYHDRPHVFAPAELTLARLLAAQISLAIVRLRAIARAERARDELVTVLETVPDGIFVVDADERLLFGNAAYARIRQLAHPAGTSYADTLAGFTIVDDAGEPVPPERMPTRIALRGDAVVQTLGFRRGDGPWRWTRVSSQPSRDATGRVRFAATVVHDVTQARRGSTRATSCSRPAASSPRRSTSRRHSPPSPASPSRGSPTGAAWRWWAKTASRARSRWSTPIPRWSSSPAGSSPTTLATPTTPPAPPTCSARAWPRSTTT